MSAVAGAKSRLEACATRALLTLVLTLLATLSLAIQSTAGPYRIDLRTDPAVVPVGRASLVLTLTDSSGKPVTGATVSALTKMPGMAMGEREETGRPGDKPGEYVVPAVFAMGGGYESQIHIDGPLGKAETKISLATGQDTAGQGGGIPWTTILIGLVVIGIVVFILIRVRQSGQRVDAKSMLNRNVLLSLVLLAAALTVAVWAVNSQRREGAMTPIEAQVMDMNTPAPEGVLPVNLVSVERKPFGESVTYTGQAVGYVEQQVVPRVTGTIVEMPVYAGDHVHKGQLLVRLDTSQLDPLVSEKAAGVATAQQGVGVAAMEYQQMLNAVSQAQVEVSTARSQLAEAKAMLTAAEQGRAAVESRIEAAQSEVEAMNAELVSAQADQTYQHQNLARMENLFKEGVIARDQFEQTQAASAKADAAVARAKENVAKAKAGVSTAQADLKRTDAEIAAARRKVDQAQSEVRARQASVKTSQSAAAAAKQKIGQSQAAVSQANAGLAGASAERGYAELRAEVDGVVTERVISPGVLVNPGQTILKVAQISPIRLQANVPEVDLARIKLGDEVEVQRTDGNGKSIRMQVTSVTPSLDPASRTGIVEAIYPNTDRSFLPGQFVSMKISLGGSRDALVVPSDAVVSQEGSSFVWVAQPEMNGQASVSRVEVKIGATSGDLVSIQDGLTEGQKVVAAPPYGLASGTRVASMEPATEAAMEQTVEITDSGYNPPTIQVPANKPFKVTFIRRAAETCGDEVIFPDLNIRKKLPLNEPVTIDLPAMPQGKALNFTCPMNMLKGKAVSR